MGQTATERADQAHAAAVVAAGGFSSIFGGGGMTAFPQAAEAEGRRDLAPAVSLVTTTVASVMRPVKPLSLAGLTPSMAESRRPTFEWVLPTELKVDESYQRTLSARSVQLIRKIVTQWDWRRFKPPVVARMVWPGRPGRGPGGG